MKIKRNIVQIDEALCNGCGQCVTGCHEGALKVIDGKARIISETYCDGLGDCIGECPLGAIRIESKDVDPYDEKAVIKHLSRNAEDAIKAETQPCSELRQWPVQLHLLNTQASYLTNSDMLLSADCVAYSYAGFHQKWLKNKSLAIACPKLDGKQENYIEKIVSMIDQAQVKTLTVIMMEVPCCGGLFQMALKAREMASRDIPMKKIVVSIHGEIIEEKWV